MELDISETETSRTQQNPVHTYTTPDIFTVSLNITNPSGFDVMTKIDYITVTEPSTVINGTIINQGATVFIGEEGLDVTNAFVQADAESSTMIGWWPSAADIETTLYSQSYDFGLSGKTNFTVGDTFVGYTGTWYALAGNGSAIAPVFYVQDPALSLDIWDFSMNANVTGYSVTQGEYLGFRINTNMYPAVDLTQRSPLNPATDGYIDIRVRDENGTLYTSLLNDSVGTPTAGPNSLLANFVDSPDWYWGELGTYVWNTGALDSGGSPYYPLGNVLGICRIHAPRNERQLQERWC